MQIRNRATVGGNLGTASSAADLNPVLWALDAQVRLVATEGQRDVPVAEFLTGYRETARRTCELIHSVWIPPRADGERRAFRKVGTRRAQSIAKVVAAMAVRLDGTRIIDLHAAVGSVAERTISLPTLAAELAGCVPDVARIRAAVRKSVSRDARPIDDVRSTGEYRSAVLGRILEQMLLELVGC